MGGEKSDQFTEFVSPTNPKKKIFFFSIADIRYKQ